MSRIPASLLLAWFIWPGADQAPVPGTLRVLTYNIHHGEGTDGKLDLDRIARVIKAAEPDIVALQEVDQKIDDAVARGRFPSRRVAITHALATFFEQEKSTVT